MGYLEEKAKATLVDLCLKDTSISDDKRESLLIKIFEEVTGYQIKKSIETLNKSRRSTFDIGHAIHIVLRSKITKTNEITK